MNKKWNIIGDAGFKFFGKMNASISHEVKNVLAIINESAGLLEDFALMAGKGMPVDPERLKVLSDRIQGQVRRADEIVKNMNTFAHSVDDSIKRLDLKEVLTLMIALSDRTAAMKGLTLKLMPSAKALMITTNPFLLENLIWLCLYFAMGMTGASKIVGLNTEATEKGANIILTRLNGLADTPTSRFPTDTENALLEILRGQIMVKEGAGEIAITLPENIAP